MAKDGENRDAVPTYAPSVIKKMEQVAGRTKFVKFTNVAGVISCVRVDQILEVVIDLEHKGYVSYSHSQRTTVVDEETARTLMDYLLNGNVLRLIITETVAGMRQPGDGDLRENQPIDTSEEQEERQ